MGGRRGEVGGVIESEKEVGFLAPQLPDIHHFEQYAETRMHKALEVTGSFENVFRVGTSSGNEI